MIEYAKYDTSINLDSMESIEFAGKCIAALARDSNLMEETGKILIAAEIALKYGFTDINGKQPISQRGMLY